MLQKKRKSLAGLKKLPCCIVLKIIDLEIQKNRSRQVELVTFIIVCNSNTKMKKQNKQSMTIFIADKKFKFIIKSYY
jgi:hypothetical protein